MNLKAQSVLALASAFTIVLTVLVSNPDILHGTSDPWFSEQLDPIRFLKRFQDVRDIGSGRRGKKGKKKKFVPPVGAPASPVGPNVILAIDTSVRMQFDENGHYYDLGTWPRADDPTVATELGVAATAVNYRRRYDGLVDDLAGTFKAEADAILAVDDQAADYADFFDPTRLGMAREGLAQAVDENDNIVRFGLVRSRYGAGAVLPATGNEQPVRLTTPPHNDYTGDLGGKRWKVTMGVTTTRNVDAASDGTEVIVAADIADGSDAVFQRLQLGPDEAGGLLPAGTGLNDSTDSPIDDLLVDTRAEVVRLMTDDLNLYRECRNTAVVLVVGGAGGLDPAATALTFASVSAAGYTHRVPIIVVAIAPPAADVATLQAIATNSGGAYFEASNAAEVTRAANHAVQLVHVLTEDFDAGRPSIFPTTSPIVGTVDLSNATDIDGVALVNSVITTASGAEITQRGNVVFTSGFSLPGFNADLRAFRTYRPELDATKPMGYRFTSDGTSLWIARAPDPAQRNLYTFIPGVGMTKVSSNAATASTLRPYLRVADDAAAAELIDFVLNQPLGAIIDSTPAVADPPSLVAPDDDYATFASQRSGRRSQIFYGGNDGMIHAVDARLGLETWGFIPFNLLPKLRTLLDGQPVDNFAYFVDSSPKVADVKIGGIWRTLLTIGQGEGGTFYQAFDVSDAGLGVPPDSDSEASVLAAFNNPAVIPFEWSFPAYSSFDHTIETVLTPFGDLGASASLIEKTVGHTWSDPAVGQVEDDTGPYVVMTGSGFLDDSIEAQGARGGVRAGTTFYLLDAATGSVHDSYDVGDDTGKDHFKNSLQGDPTATGPANSRFVTQVFAADTEGILWRFNMSTSGGVASLAVPIESYDAQEEHPVFASLALLNLGGTTQYVFFATGIDIMQNLMKVEDYRLIGVRDDATRNKRARREFSYTLTRQAAATGDERPTSAPAVAGEVVFFTTTTEFPNDPCRCHESALYALTYDGNQAYGAGTGGRRSKKGKSKSRSRIEEVASWEGRSSAPFVSDQHLYYTVDDDLRVLGDPDDYNNGVSSQGVRMTSWRELRP